MNIDAKFFGAIIFVIVQTCGAIWWASGLSAEVERLAGIQGRAIPALEAEAKQCGIEIHNLKKLTGVLRIFFSIQVDATIRIKTL